MGTASTRRADDAGRVPPLSGNLLPAPECFPPAGTTDSTELAPGDRVRLETLSPGIHRFQCYFRPWMRAEIKVAG